MADKLTYMPNDDEKVKMYLFYKLQLAVKTFGHLTH